METSKGLEHNAPWDDPVVAPTLMHKRPSDFDILLLDIILSGSLQHLKAIPGFWDKLSTTATELVLLLQL